MEHLIPFFEIVTLVINLFSILILIIGVVLCAGSLIKLVFVRPGKQQIMYYVQRIRTQLGGYVLLGLEILIVADIIESVIRPTFNDIIRLAAIVTIRTVISFFLNREIREFQTADEKAEAKE